MASQGLAIAKSCNAAVNFFKVLAERGDWVAAMTKAGTHMRNGER